MDLELQSGHVTEDHPRKQPRSLKVRLLLWVGLPLGLLLGIALMVDAYGRGRLRVAIRQARSDGKPVTFQELEDARKVWPDDQNGALVLVRLADRLSALRNEDGVDALPEFGYSSAWPLGEQLRPDQDRAAAVQLERLAPELAQIDQLARYKGGRFPVTVAANPLETLLPHLGIVRTSVRLKASQVEHKAVHGDTSRIVEDIDILLRHGLLLRDEPVLISSLTWMTCDDLVISTIERVCGLAVFSDSQLQTFRNLLMDFEANDHLTPGIRGKRGGFVSFAEYVLKSGNPATPGLAMPLPKGATYVPAVRGWVMHDLATGLRLYNRLVSAAQDRRLAKRVTAEMDAELQSLPVYYVFTRLFIPSLGLTFTVDLRLTAKARAARAALAAERFRLDTRQFPETLDKLVPRYLKAVPLDPFDDQPLRYVTDAHGAVIYSVNDDLKDDGGDVPGRPGLAPAPVATAPATSPAYRTYADIGFVLLRPELRGRPASPAASRPAE